MLTIAAPAQDLMRSLEEWRATIDGMLQAIPDNRLEARGVIIGELGIRPEPRELDAIVRLAHDPINEGALRELTTTALVVRVLAERSVSELLDPLQPCSESARRAATMVSGLLDTVDAWQGEVQRARESLDEEAQEFLLEMGEALLPEAESLITGSVLAPRMLQIIAAAEQGDPRGSAPGLTDDEAQAVAHAFGAAEAQAPQTEPVYFVGAILRTVIEEDVATSEALEEGEEPDEQLLDRMRKARTAYRYVTRLLKAKETEARDSGELQLADRLVATQQALYGAYLTLLPVLNPGADPADDGLEATDRLEALLRESAQLDSIADEARLNEVSTELEALEAVKKLRAGESEVQFVAPPREVKTGGLRSERNRIRLGLVIAVVLGAFVAGIYGPRLTREKFEPRIPLAEIPAKLELLDVITVGRMMHATTSSASWQALETEQRRAGVDNLAQTATQRGMQTLFLTDESKEELAIWTADDGVRLIGKPSPSR